MEDDTYPTNIKLYSKTADIGSGASGKVFLIVIRYGKLKFQSVLIWEKK